MKRPTAAEINDAMDVISRAIGGRIEHGRTSKGTVAIGDLDVTVTIVATRVVPRVDADEYRRRAMELLASEGWRDRCGRTVKNRSYWSLTKTKECSAKVTSVMVRKRHDVQNGKLVEVDYFDFCCGHHEEQSPDVIAIVRLPLHELKTMRELRQREIEERRARDYAAERELEKSK